MNDQEYDPEDLESIDERGVDPEKVGSDNELWILSYNTTTREEFIHFLRKLAEEYRQIPEEFRSIEYAHSIYWHNLDLHNYLVGMEGSLNDPDETDENPEKPSWNYFAETLRRARNLT
ncbi:MAG: hypothetical protein MPJ24_11520 [Pirellulaceae bacterium]|nr:hypothetical protein [Pirellulaceae bacterium]